MLTLSDIALSYGSRKVLSSVTLRFGQGTIAGIVGPSGTGKSSLLKIAAGQLNPSAGEVSLHGKKLPGPSMKLIPEYKDIQLVNQDFNLDKYHTVVQNVREKILHLPKEDQQILMDEVLDLVELGHLRNQQAYLLSGGEQQRLSFARALACEPEVLLLDEPFAHLDQRLRLKIMDHLLRLNEIRKIVIVIVSHDGAEILGVVNRLIHLSDARVVRDDVPERIYYAPDSLEQAELLGPVNNINIGDKQVMFRPNEYDLDCGAFEIDVKFQRAVNTGLLIFNYFETKQKEQVVLTSQTSLQEIEKIYIRRYELVG